ncbi:hypothetical protein [Streptomyces sp. ME19-01-6]|uniref:hypothetical protein n=1 Tax=Streptomyces sp. ME19-01-6 TaxID=3028686 RepID=UPI0029A623CE|nr:hypothetical protein [Streptomyces sp. ME19-01-6]MDX3228895.1 hypothetical protein [Streptomyces sp. ME19-01-6]
MAGGQLPSKVEEFARYLRALTRRLDAEQGWYGVFAQRDPEGMRACLDGREVPPWDVVQALLQDLSAQRGPDVAREAAARAAGLYRASATAYDTTAGGRAALQDRLEAMLGEQRRAAKRERELHAAVREPTAEDDSDARERLSTDLAWARDDWERATARCEELRARLDALDARTASPRDAYDDRLRDGGRSNAGAGAVARPRGSRFATAYDGAVGGQEPAGPASHEPAARWPGAAAAGAGGADTADGLGGAGRAAEEPGVFGAAAGPGAPGAEVAGAGAPGAGRGHWAAGPARSAEAGWASHADGAGSADGGAGLRAGAGAAAGAGGPGMAEELGGRGAAAAAGGFGAAAGPGGRGAAAGASGPGAAAGRGGGGGVGPGGGGSVAAAGAAGAGGGAAPRSRPRGARFAGLEEPAPVSRPRGARFAGAAPAEPAGTAQAAAAEAAGAFRAEEAAAGGAATPRGARFAGAYEGGDGAKRRRRLKARDEAERRAAQESARAAEARRTAAEAVDRLARLRADGRGGEAHVLLCEAAAGPAPWLPLLAAELERAGLEADVATLLWEVACLPPAALAAAAGALVAAGRGDDGARLLRQSVARPVTEVAQTVLALLASGSRAEAAFLLEALVRARRPDEAAQAAVDAPAELVPLLLDAASGVSSSSHHDLAHALRVAGLPGVPGLA